VLMQCQGVVRVSRNGGRLLLTLDAVLHPRSIERCVRLMHKVKKEIKFRSRDPRIRRRAVIE
jgi:hypothetical protein